MKMQERKEEAAEFLIDTRKLPLELRWKIQGMVEPLEFMGANPSDQSRRERQTVQERVGA